MRDTFVRNFGSCVGAVETAKERWYTTLLHASVTYPTTDHIATFASHHLRVIRRQGKDETQILPVMIHAIRSFGRSGLVMAVQRVGRLTRCGAPRPCCIRIKICNCSVGFVLGKATTELVSRWFNRHDHWHTQQWGTMAGADC